MSLTVAGADGNKVLPDIAIQLFSDDCRYFETPFSEPQIGREGVARYWQAVPESQSDITFRYQVLAVQAQTVIAHWSASFTRIPSHTRVNLDGVFVLEFTDAGLCSTLREWWHREETQSRQSASKVRRRTALSRPPAQRLRQSYSSDTIAR